MYCPECGQQNDENSNYCRECGANLRDSTGGEKTDNEPTSAEDYDIFMSIQDGFERTKLARTIIDVGAILISAGFWFGWVAVEYISHHYKLKKGEREPYEEGDEKLWSLM